MLGAWLARVSAVRLAELAGSRTSALRLPTAPMNRRDLFRAARALITSGIIPYESRENELQAEVPGYHHALDFVGALADLEDLLVAVEARDRRLVHEAVAAVDLERLVHDPV